MIFFANVGFLQKVGQVGDVVADQKTGESIPFATVLIMNEGTNTSTGAVSDADGKFSIANVALHY